MVLGTFAGVSATSSAVEPLAVTVVAPAPADSSGFHLGTATSPDGSTLTVDNRSLVLNGKPWTPVMGEFHYTRYPANEWRGELLKMKAGGISVVATYVFWIHHEEVEGDWNWSGQHDLREFVREAGAAGLKVVVRCGPWCHGEVRNGGFPDWLLQKGWKLRSEDPAFLAKVTLLYGQIARQLDHLLWKDGGPVIGIQVDNEFDGPAEYLLALKKIARAAGLDVPVYTRTGWPQLHTPMPFGEIIPLYGSYAEGFWDRELTSMPGKYWNAFRFSTLRVDENVANEQLGRREARDAPDVARYPYLTCEIGGGMMNSYHRRILIHPADIESTLLVKLGSGSTLPGYYMYHGGTNPPGKLSTLMEAQATQATNYNDLPVKNYDFQAPLGEFGQIRPQYHLLRRLHLFLNDFGSQLAGMPPALPAKIPQGREDATTLRWVVRSDGQVGFVFVSNYERARTMPAKEGVQFAIALPGRKLVFPATPVTVPADARFLWPFAFALGHGVKLDWATAQPLCLIDEDKVRTVFFAETKGVTAQFAIAGEGAPRSTKSSRAAAFELKGNDGGTVRVVLLDESDSLALWKSEWRGRDRVFLTHAGLVVDGDALRLSSGDLAELKVSVFPAVAKDGHGASDGVFTALKVVAPAPAKLTVSVTELHQAGPPREIRLGQAEQPVAEQPSDAEFAQAAVWRINLPKDLDLSTDPILRFHYTGDVARLTLNGRLITDDFYNGGVWEIGLRRLAPEVLSGDLRIVILPLRKDAISGEAKKIYVDASAVPDFGAAESAVALPKVEILPRYEVQAGVSP